MSFALILAFLLPWMTVFAPNTLAASRKTSTCENGECIPKLIHKLEELGKVYKAQCLPKNIRHVDIPKYHQEHPLTESCWKYITEIDHLENELQTYQSKLETRLGCETGNCKLPKSSQSLNFQLANLTKVEEKLSCTEPKKKFVRNHCAQDLNCVLQASALSMGGYIAEKIIPKKYKITGCHLGNDSCTTQLVTAFVKSVVNLFTGAWDLLKLAGRKTSEQMTKFWHWVSGAENHSSTAQLALAKASKDPGIFHQIVHDFPGTMKKMWNAFVASMKEWMKTSVFCQKWSGVPQFSRCVEPAVSFDCLSCKSFVTGLCSISGTILSEVVPAFLSGGLFEAIKYGASGAAKIARLYKVTRKSLEIIKESRAGKIAVEASSKADEVLKLTRGLRATKIIVDSALSAIKAYMLSPARRALKISYTALTDAARKGRIFIGETSTGKVLVFSGKALKKTSEIVLYPIDNQLTAFAYRAGSRSFQTAMKIGKPTLASRTIVTAALIQRNPGIESLLIRIQKEKDALIPNSKNILKLESELSHAVSPVRADVLKDALSHDDVNFSEIIKKIYPELQYGSLAKITPKEKVLTLEKELYLQISELPDGPKKLKLMSRYQEYLAPGERRAAILGDAKTPFSKEGAPLEKVVPAEKFNRVLTPKEKTTKISIRSYMERGFQEMKKKAIKTEERIKSAKGPVVYDTVAVGAGPNTSVAVAAMKETNPNLNILVIEGTENLGTFHRVKGFDLNTPEWIGNSGNTFPSSTLQLKDFNVNGAAYATAEDLGYVTQSAFEIADVDMIFGNKLVRWTKEPSPGAWPAKYKIETSKGNVIYTNSGVFAPGLGGPVNRLKHPSSIKLVESYQNEAKAIDLAKDPTYVPRFQDVEQYIMNATRDERLGRGSISRYNSKTTLIVGEGDGGNIGVETALGLNKLLNPNELKTGVKVIWMGQPATKGEEFLNHLNTGKKSRYSRIAKSIDEGSVTPVNGYLSRVEEFKDSDGLTRFKAFYTSKSGAPVGKPVIVDNIVFATGYTNSHSTIMPLFSPEVQGGISTSIKLEPFKGSVNQYTRYYGMMAKTPSEITKQVIINGQKEDVFILGIGSKTPISKRKAEIVTGGFIDLTGPRAAATGNYLAQKLTPQKVTLEEMQRLLTPKEGKFLEFFRVENRSTDPIGTLRTQAVADIHTKIELGKVLREFKSKPNIKFSLNIEAKDNGFTFGVLGLEEKAAEELVEAISKNSKLIQGLNEEARLGRSKIALDLSTRESGLIKSETMQFRSEIVSIEKPLEQPLNVTGGLNRLATPTFKSVGKSEQNKRDEAEKRKTHHK